VRGKDQGREEREMNRRGVFWEQKERKLQKQMCCKQVTCLEAGEGA
jgi:hypothetical protein